MTEGFVCHPDGTVDPPGEDYPDTGYYSMSAESEVAGSARYLH